MKSSPRTALLAISAVFLFIVGALAFGWSRGELLLPGRSFHTVLQRATNPLGFYVLTAFYAALAGACVYLLYLLRAAGQPRRTAQPQPALKPQQKGDPMEDPMNLDGRVTVTQEGRGGNVLLSLPGGTHSFWWEFGGGDCIAFVDVPGTEQWSRLAVLADFPRTELLNALAREVGRMKCPGASYRVTAGAIEYFNSNAAR
jgi:hypothetical protein